MPKSILLTLAIVTLQWLLTKLPFIHLQYDPNVMFYGSVQALFIIMLHYVANKYIKF